MSNRTFLIVHGGLFNSSSWQPVRDELAARGYPSECPTLPTCSLSGGRFDDDVATIAEKRNLDCSETSIVLLAHSYGALVANEALEQSRPAKVERVFFVAGLLAPPEISLTKFF